MTTDIESNGRRVSRWSSVRSAGILAVALAMLSVLAGPVRAEETDYSPGPLSAAHAGLDDPDSCDNCHNDDFEVEGERCLVCHDAIADRLAAKKGVHRDVTVDDCAVCHAEHRGRDAEMLPLDRSTFDHAEETGFALEGFHGEFRGDCSRCHTTDSFLTLSTKCSTCHEDVHKGTLGTECTVCHAVDRHFKSASRAFHKSTLLPLEGRHLDVPCAKCHWNGQLKGTPTRCYDCHWIRRQDDPNRTRLGNECENCHRPTSWTAVTWDHSYTGQPLNVPHRTVDCVGCHPGRRYDGAVPPDCFSCHGDDYRRAEDPDHLAAGFPTDCWLCHDPNDPSFGLGDFVHPYPLVGVHATLDCASCHAGGIYQGTPTDCVGCHLDDYNGSQNPDHPAAGFPTDCELCHRQSDSSWHDATFDHPYELVGVHATLDCQSCHQGGIYEGTPTDCIGCHEDDYNQSVSPNHPAAGFPTNCVVCHQPTDPDWHQATYPHVVFPLVGSHTMVECSSCHTGDVYQGLPSDCVDCHLDDYNSTQNPNHTQAGFPTTCEICHTPTSWQDATFDHPFQLEGVHATLQCNACHANGYPGTPTDCVGCHESDYNSTQNPNHTAAGFPVACDACHRFSDPNWQQATYPHTVWPLVGTHQQQECISCHTGDVYQGLPSDCVDCHLEDYNSTQNPNHTQAGFPTTCEVCHTPTSWGDASFDHPIQLEGVHATLDCQACHANGYPGTPTDCVGCHQDDYNQSVNPNHPAAGFPTACDSCHSFSDPDWHQATYPHTVWPLVGTHQQQECISCHTGDVYQGLPSECVDCHIEDYNSTQNPNHTQVGFPTTCEVCHTPTSWHDGNFDHPFPLEGVHATLDCQACHANGYPGTPTDCVGCHEDDFNGATNPNHVAAGFPTTCDSCHSFADPDWHQATYPHSVWPLVGNHAQQECITCHSSGVYQGLPSDCVDCHLDDYNGTTDPNHALAGFPTTCEICHDPSDSSWEDGNFNHPFQLEGVHATLNCLACHANGYPGTPTDCVGCHEDDYNGATNPDHIAAGFPTTCDSCHGFADPNWQEADYPHTVWPLVGNHAQQECITCHSSGVYQGLPSDCVDCHLDDYNSTTDPDHVAAGFPTTCEYCHNPSDTSWNQGNFTHPYFPITSGPHGAADCNDCHINPSNFGIFSCISGGCHPQTQTVNHHEGVPGFVYDSAACYACHPDGQPPDYRSRPRSPTRRKPHAARN